MKVKVLLVSTFAISFFSTNVGIVIHVIDIRRHLHSLIDFVLASIFVKVAIRTKIQHSWFLAEHWWQCLRAFLNRFDFARKHFSYYIALLTCLCKFMSIANRTSKAVLGSMLVWFTPDSIKPYSGGWCKFSSPSIISSTISRS